MTSSTESLLKTSLHGLHVALGARMVPFAGYDMPVQYADGILKEHLHTRAAAGLFDVSHMGQAVLRSDGDVAAALETLVPADIKGLAPGQMRLTLLLNDRGGNPRRSDGHPPRRPEPPGRAVHRRQRRLQGSGFRR